LINITILELIDSFIFIDLYLKLKLKLKSLKL